MGLRTKTSILMAAVVVAAMTVLGAFFLRNLERSIRESVLTGVRSVSSTLADSISRFLDDSLQDAKAISAGIPREALLRQDVPAIEQYLKSMMEIYPKFENGMFLLDARGSLWADYPSTEARGNSFAFREYFQRTVAEKKGVVGSAYRSARTGQPVITFTAVLRDGTGQMTGLLGCSARLLSPDALGGMRNEKIGQTGYIYVYDRSRLMILHPEDGRVLQRDVPPGANRLFDAAIDGFEGVGETVNSRGVPMLLSLRRIPATDWIVAAQQPREEAFVSLAEARSRVLLGIFGAAVLAALLGGVAVQRITRPLVRLQQATFHLGESGFQDHLDNLSSSDEIGDLCRTFREMSRKLNQSMSSLKDATRDWEKTFDAVPDALFLLDRESRITRINRAAADWLKLDFSKAVGRRCCELVHNTPEAIARCPHQITLQTGKVARSVVENLPGGRIMEIITSPITGASGEVSGTVHIARDITAEKSREKEIRESEERYRDIVENSIDAIFTVDLKGNFTSCNQAMTTMIGIPREEIIGRNFREFMDSDKAQPVFQDFSVLFHTERPLFDQRYEAATGDGRRVVLRGNVRLIQKKGRKVGFQGILRDVTDQERVEASLQRVEKIEAIGTLAGGIAHDFNNFLAAILGYLNLVRFSLDEPKAILKNIEEAERAVLRATGLTRQLLTFAKGGEPVKEVVLIPPLVEEAVNMVLGQASRCSHEVVYDGNLRPVSADRNQIIQVLTNLLINARQAMPEGGTIRIAARNRRIEESDTVEALRPGEYVSVSVEDQGIGIPAGNLKRIFDPFYSTKTEGSGLGLATCHSIISRHGGHIEVSSRTAEGSIFIFHLPAAAGSAESLPGLREDLFPGQGRILVMDDEVHLLDMVAQALKMAGYRVETAENGEKAVHAYREAMEQKDPFAAVIFDLTIPGGMGGRDAMAAIREFDPAARGIVSSGYSHDPVMSNPAGYGFAAAIQKPFRLVEMTRVLKALVS